MGTPSASGSQSLTRHGAEHEVRLCVNQLREEATNHHQLRVERGDEVADCAREHAGLARTFRGAARSRETGEQSHIDLGLEATERGRSRTPPLHLAPPCGQTRPRIRARQSSAARQRARHHRCPTRNHSGTARPWLPWPPQSAPRRATRGWRRFPRARAYRARRSTAPRVLPLASQGAGAFTTAPPSKSIRPGTATPAPTKPPPTGPDAHSATSEAASCAAAATASDGLGTFVNAARRLRENHAPEAHDGHAHGVDVWVNGERANGARRPNHGAGPANGAALTKFARLV